MQTATSFVPRYFAAKAAPTGKWVADAKVLFVRGGKACYDIGWVGVIQSEKKVNDGKWHRATITVKDGLATLYVDGKRWLHGENKVCN